MVNTRQFLGDTWAIFLDASTARPTRSHDTDAAAHIMPSLALCSRMRLEMPHVEPLPPATSSSSLSAITKLLV